MRLEGKVALVTGGGSGIGRAVAERFTAEGARVVIADIKGAEEAAAAVGQGTLALELDVSSGPSVQRAVTRLRNAVDRVDILVNNAGVTVAGRAVELEESEWDRQLDVNLKSVYLVTRAVSPLLLEGSSIVNTASVSGFFVMPGQAAYTVSKAGVIMLTRQLAVELASRGVRVNCVCPGVIATPMTIGRAQPGGPIARLAERCPLGRLGTPEEVAAVVLFLASDDARYVTGEAVVVDGGLTVGSADIDVA